MNPFNKLNGSRRWLEAYDYVEEDGGHTPSPYAKAIAEALVGKVLNQQCSRVLELGCGSGIVGIYCLLQKKASLVTFNDIVTSWLSVTRENVRMWIKDGSIRESQIRYFEGDFSGIPDETVRQHDVVFFNLPQLVEEHVDPEQLRRIRADGTESHFRLAGRDGLDVARSFLGWYRRIANPKPRAVILLSSFHGRKLIEDTIREYGLEPEFIANNSALLRRSFHAAARRLSEDQKKDRQLRQNPHGEWLEELLTISLQERPSS